MAGEQPAASAAAPPPADDANLLADAAPAEAAASAESAPPAETPAGETPAAETKPEGQEPKGKDGEGEQSPDLLADDDEGKAPEQADGPADAKKDGAPETYEAFTLPENVPLDEAALAKAAPVFRDVGLNQEQAQKLVTLYAEFQQNAATQQVAQFTEVKKAWAGEIKADPEFGGDKLAQTLGAAKSVLGKFGDKALLNDLSEWGWSNHPGLIRLLARVNAHLSEDTLVHTDAAAQSRPKSAAQRIYPNMPGDNQ